MLITPFKSKCIPPPMSHNKLDCSKQVNKVIWSNESMDVLAYLADGTFVIFKYTPTEGSLNS